MRVPSSLRVGVNLCGASVEISPEVVVHGVEHNTADGWTTLTGELLSLIMMLCNYKVTKHLRLNTERCVSIFISPLRLSERRVSNRLVGQSSSRPRPRQTEDTKLVRVPETRKLEDVIKVVAPPELYFLYKLNVFSLNLFSGCTLLYLMLFKYSANDKSLHFRDVTHWIKKYKVLHLLHLAQTLLVEEINNLFMFF